MNACEWPQVWLNCFLPQGRCASIACFFCKYTRAHTHSCRVGTPLISTVRQCGVRYGRVWMVKLENISPRLKLTECHGALQHARHQHQVKPFSQQQCEVRLRSLQRFCTRRFVCLPFIPFSSRSSSRRVTAEGKTTATCTANCVCHSVCVCVCLKWNRNRGAVLVWCDAARKYQRPVTRTACVCVCVRDKLSGKSQQPREKHT